MVSGNLYWTFNQLFVNVLKLSWLDFSRGMSWCASFGIKFWEGYRELIPQDPGFTDRKPLYDAYHQLNHYNLFGGGYLGSAQSLLQQVKKNLDAKEKK